MKRRLTTLFAAVLVLAGCGRIDAEDVSGLAPAEEERLVVYTSHKEEVYGPIIKEFEERTGIWVEVETGETAELLERISGGESGCDLMFGGGVDSLEARRDLFAPYVSDAADAVWPAYRCEDGSWTPFSALTVVLIYNPKLCRVNPPADWDSLLDPAWRGRIAFADPEVSGSSYTALATLLQVMPGDETRVMGAFVQNLTNGVLDNSRDVVGAVADGSCYIGVTMEDVALRIQAGYDIAMVYPERGTSVVPDGMAVVAGCAHEENARRFIDFALGADVQNHLVESCARRSVLTELFQGTDMAEDLTLCDYDLQWASARQEELLALWRELRGEAEP